MSRDVGRDVHAEGLLGVARDQRGRGDQRDVRAHRLEARGCPSAPRASAAMSPTKAMCRPSSGPTSRSIVYRSSRVWVGCSCLPSPALITAASVWRAAIWQRADGVVADDQDVRGVGRQGEDRVLERLALLDARARALHVDHVRRQALAGQLERGRGARGGLEEHVDDRPPAERRHLLDVALHDLREAVAHPQDARDLCPVQVGDRDQRSACHDGTSASSSSTTSSAPSISSRRTLTRWEREVGRFFPT